MAATWPTMTDYQEAVQAPKICFDDGDLKAGMPVLTKLGLPRPICGQFASVYELENGGSRWAIKCFLRNIPDLHSRYAKIAKHLDTLNHPYFMTFNYLQKGIRVRGQMYPLVKMEWVEGLPLNVYIENILGNKAAMDQLEARWMQLLEDLKGFNIAHGDLQHGNVLVADDGSFRLIDYDGMWVPKLKGSKAHETGHPDYQSPLRGEKDFHADLDQFAGDVIQMAIRALQHQPDLWHKYNNGDNMLFKRGDYLDPKSASLFDDLRALGDQEITDTLEQIIAACGGKMKKGRANRFFKPKKVDPIPAASGNVVKAANAPAVAPAPVKPAPAPAPAPPKAQPKPAPPKAQPAPAPAPAKPQPVAPAKGGAASWLSDHVSGGVSSAPAPTPVKPAAPAPVKPAPAKPAPAPAPAPAKAAPAPAPVPAKPATPAPAARPAPAPAPTPVPSGPVLPLKERMLGYGRLLLHLVIMTPVTIVTAMETMVLTAPEGDADRATAILVAGFGSALVMGLLSLMSLFVGRAIHKAASTMFFGITAMMVLLNMFAELFTAGWSDWTGNDPFSCAMLLVMLIGSAAALGIEAWCRSLGVVTVWRLPWSRE